MKVFSGKNVSSMKGGNRVVNRRRDTQRHIPLLQHERRALIYIEFDETDWELMKDVFGDEDTARAAAEVISEAPPEIQILAVQLMNIIKEVA